MIDEDIEEVAEEVTVVEEEAEEVEDDDERICEQLFGNFLNTEST